MNEPKKRANAMQRTGVRRPSAEKTSVPQNKTRDASESSSVPQRRRRPSSEAPRNDGYELLNEAKKNSRGEASGKLKERVITISAPADMSPQAVSDDKKADGAKKAAHAPKSNANHEGGRAKKTAAEKKPLFSGMKKAAGRKKAEAETKKKDDTFHVSKGISDRRRKRLIICVSVVAAVLVSLLLVNALLPAGLAETTGNFFAVNGKGGTLPVSISATADRTVVPCGSCVAVTDEATVSMYTSSGGTVFSRMHGFTDPVMRASGTRVLLFDRSNTGYRIESASETLLTGTSSNSIITGDISENGAFAIALASEGYTSQAEVYNKKGVKKYIWYSADQRITALSLSNDGRYLAVGTLGSVSGEFSSSVILLDTKSSDPVFRREYVGSMLISLDIKGDNTVAVFGDRIVSLSRDASEQTVSFSGETLSFCDNSDSSGTLMVFSRYSDERNNYAVFYDAKLGESCRFDALFSIRKAVCSQSYIALAAEDGITCYDRKGVLCGSVKTDFVPSCVAICSGKVFYTGTEQLDGINARGAVSK